MPRIPYPEITSITEVDDLMAGGDIPPQATSTLQSFELRFSEQSEAYRRLLHIKFLYRTSSVVEEHYQERRNFYLQDPQNASLFHLSKFESRFMEINRTNDYCFGDGRVRSFLDLGCSPGGFSNWLMKNNREARGAGITLGDGEAKVVMPSVLSTTYGPRYRVVYDNIVTLVMGYVAADTNPVLNIHSDLNAGDDNDHAFLHDLIIAGAFPTMEGHIPWWQRVQLSLSQILIVLSNLTPGGSCIFLINTKGFLWLVDAIGLLYQCFESVTASKSEKLHALRSSCYLVCKGFKASEEELERFTGRLRETLRWLNATSLARHAEPEDVDVALHKNSGPTVVERRETIPLIYGNDEAHLLEMGLDKIVLGLFEPLWCTQFNAIHANFEKVLKRTHLRPSAMDLDAEKVEDIDQPGSPSSPPSPSIWRPRRPSISVSAISTWQATDHFPSSPLGRDTPISPTSPFSMSLPHTPSDSPYVPKWRPPQRRASTFANCTDNREWRRPAESGLAPDPQETVILPKLSGRKQGYSVTTNISGSVSAADASAWWRK